MKSNERTELLKIVANLSPYDVEKLRIFVAGLQAGKQSVKKSVLVKQNYFDDNNKNKWG